MTVVVTLDVDWADDALVDAAAAVLRDGGVPATWFCTHASPALERLRADPALFELGIHPNFRPGSSHGDTVAGVLDHVMAVVPEAVSSRSHGVVQSGEILAALVERTPVRIDCTTFWPAAVPPAPVRQPTPHGDLVRVPFVWSDDFEPLRARPDWDLRRFCDPPAGSLAVLLFHPVRVGLDLATQAEYERARHAPPGTPAQRPGPRRAFEQLVGHLGRSGRARRLRDAVGL